MRDERGIAGPRLSIVIPCLDEAAGIVAALELLQPLRRRGVEVIVVDGGSSDNSAALAAPLTDLALTAPRGRASQMNAGAAAAHGDFLLFLHVDCTLPPDADRLVVNALAARGRHWGRFDVRLTGAHPWLRAIAFMMNWRSRLTGMVTGDQGLFVTRARFTACGGFPQIPLMEDIAISQQLKMHSVPVVISARIAASGRRWQQHGILRTMLLMWRLRLAYFFGSNPAELAEQYPHARDRH